MALAFSLVERSGLSAGGIQVLERSFHARNYADACAEEALRLITTEESYSGDGSFSFDKGSCEFSINAEGTTSEIASRGESEETIRKVYVTVETIAPEEEGEPVAIASIEWDEVADF
jgi:hypothetical protein